jgi:hypothetical protein
MGRPRLLDLFCGAGGAAMGDHRAGFDVTGVDIVPQKNYPFPFRQADALEYLAAHGNEYDAIHASPPCQHYANVTRWRGDQSDHPDLLPETRRLLTASGLPWVIENVPGSPMRADLMLCGSMFGIAVRRHRWFETSWGHFGLLPACQHDGLLPFEHKGERAYADAMGCDWMNKTEAREAIPPAYTEFIGRQLLAAMEATA